MERLKLNFWVHIRIFFKGRMQEILRRKWNLVAFIIPLLTYYYQCFGINFVRGSNFKIACDIFKINND